MKRVIEFLKFKNLYFVYLGLLVCGMLFFLIHINNVLVQYENSQADNVATVVVENFRNALAKGTVLDMLTLSDSDSARLEKLAHWENEYQLRFSSCELTCKLNKNSHSDTSPVYDILADDSVIATLQLQIVKETSKLGILSIPDWAIVSIVPNLSLFLTQYTCSLPSDFILTVDGICLSNDAIVSVQDGISTYSFEALSDEPTITITDSFNNPAAFEIEDKVVYVDFKLYCFEVPKSFTVTMNGQEAGADRSGDTACYNIGSTDNTVPVIYDDFGNEVAYSISGFYLIPEYTIYTVTAAENHTVYFDGISIPASTCISRTPIDDCQYTDSSLNLLTYSVGITHEPVVEIVDSEFNNVDFIVNATAITALPSDYTVSIPDNFTLTVNGLALSDTASYTTKSISDYKYVEEYAVMPKLNTYTISRQYNVPEVIITDNLGNKIKAEWNDKTFTYTTMASYDSIPDAFASQVDVSAIAHAWSLFLTNDLDGSKNGYYNIKQYLIDGSYYDTVAYSWATGIDITFISNHIMLNPPFVNESISNVVVYSDILFSCDIYFQKKMQLTRTGKTQTDTFSHRMFFLLYSGPDGTDTPTWVIADMFEVEL